MVGLHSAAEDFGVIVLALDEGFTSEIVMTLNLRGVELDMVGTTGGRVDTTALNTLNKDIVIDLELNSLVNDCLLLLEHAIELLSLDSGSWETVKEHSALTLGLLRGILNQTNNELIGNEFTTVHNLLSLLAELCALSNSIS